MPQIQKAAGTNLWACMQTLKTPLDKEGFYFEELLPIVQLDSKRLI